MIDSDDTNSWEWDYFQWSKVFSSDQIKEINQKIEDNYSTLENSKDGATWKNISTVKNVSYGLIKHLIEPIVDHAHTVANMDFGYNIFNTQDTILLNHNTYDSKDKSDYAWHTDRARKSVVDVKLTLLINLSEEPFEGGEFQIFNSQKEKTIDFYSQPGSAFMFKSHILHRVLPLTSGIRKSLTLFLQGPRFQ
tara:strand:- start:93 stop:671 length:579 start_codon:yes stop_codon:yes gene_type:complete